MSRPKPPVAANQAAPKGSVPPPWLLMLFPFLRWWRRVDRGTLKVDFLAGLTGAVVVLPQGVAFATIAGMPPEYGLYAGIVPAIVAALWGSSWHLVSGPTTAASIVVFSSLSVFAEPGSADYVRLALTLTLMVGVLELAMGLARLGSSGQLHLALGGGGLHRRGRLPDRRQPVQELLRDRHPPRAALPRDARDPAAEHRAHQSLRHRCGRGDPGLGARGAPLVSPLPLHDRGHGRGQPDRLRPNQVLGVEPRASAPSAPSPAAAAPVHAGLLPRYHQAARPGGPGGDPASRSPRRSPSPAPWGPGPTSTSTATRSSSARGCPTSPAPSSPAMWPPARSTAAGSTSRPVPGRPWRRSSRACCWRASWSWWPPWRPICPMRPWRRSCSWSPGG